MYSDVVIVKDKPQEAATTLDYVCTVIMLSLLKYVSVQNQCKAQHFSHENVQLYYWTLKHSHEVL